MTVVYVVIGVVVFVALLIAVSYNRFVTQRNLIRDSWSNVDTELRRRYDLVPNLVETVKGYAKHERDIMVKVSEARAAAVSSTGAPADQARTENALVQSLRQLFAVAENYPELKASANFLDLQNELTNTEDRIQAARRFYNANVRDYNRRVHSIPSAVIARTFGFRDEQFFEIEQAIRSAGAPAADFGTR